MIKRYKIVAYAILVKAGKWSLEPIEDDVKPFVPEEYRIAIAEYLATE